jgi:hypothetical protein
MRPGRALALLSAVLLATGCDLGPSGPGTLTARASGESLGGVVLEIQGRGIRGFSGRGSTRVYSAPVAARPGVHRVILVDPVGGEIGFDIEVDDRGMDGPVATVVQAARTDNTMMLSSGVTVRIAR